jgi:hypothetical protein
MIIENEQFLDSLSANALNIKTVLNKKSRYFQQSLINYCEFMGYEKVEKIIKENSKFKLI